MKGCLWKVLIRCWGIRCGLLKGMEENMMINNLFNYATSELSQDAFICWLASFSLQESRSDIALKKCADEMIGMFVPELKNQDFVLIDIKRQVQHVDVLLTVKSDKNIYKIIVEDKTHTREHDNQLKTYLTQIKKSFPESKVCGVYYKTGFQCNLSPVSEAGYTIVTRENMLALLKKYVSETNNQILHDYFNYWSDFQSESEKFRNVPLSEWEYRQINGFYDHLIGFFDRIAEEQFFGQKDRDNIHEVKSIQDIEKVLQIAGDYDKERNKLYTT
jgi:hypothetical protein